MRHNLEHLMRGLWGMLVLGQCTEYNQVNMTRRHDLSLTKSYHERRVQQTKISSVCVIHYPPVQKRTFKYLPIHLQTIFLQKLLLVYKYFVSFPDSWSNEAAGQNIKERDLFPCKNLLAFLFFPYTYSRSLFENILLVDKCLSAVDVYVYHQIIICFTNK